ncbi:MAG: 30S ribosomal protein S12 methylthiotransferase RimO [Planctomycetes bacterium]|nr:30S ribosomal protein S12 methylthiotransferase RimO [Planctomycetota bacterium]
MSDPTFVSLVHLGCARNLIDSELILGRMGEQGLVVTDDPSTAHTVVVNTCSFIGPAQTESENAIKDLLERKARGEIQGVVVAGCLVQRYRRKLQERFPQVDFFAEISDYTDLARRVRELADGRSVPRYLEGPAERSAALVEGGRLRATPGSYSYLRISHGCDHKCTFCTIPSIRGLHRSKPIENLVNEARELADEGTRELILVAEDSTWWGRDIGKELPELLEALGEVDGIRWIRLMYAYPNRFPWDVARLMREHPKVLPYIDIPVQHAATPVLRAMGRAGSGDQVRKVLGRLREEVPDLTIRTTFLMGFPGETDEDAAEVVDLVREFRLSRVGAFTYSPEPGTPAFELPGQVSAADAEARYTAVLEARDEVLLASQEALIGRELEVLVDEPARGRDYLVARGPMDAPEVDLFALVTGSDALPGDFLKVRVEGVGEQFDLVCTPDDGTAS